MAALKGSYSFSSFQQSGFAISMVMNPNDEPAQVGGRRILFVNLGSFSHINEHVRDQLATHFRDHAIETFDVKDYVKRQFGPVALNALFEVITYGPAVLADPSKRHAFFFQTPFMFRHLAAGTAHIFGPRADQFAFAIQTQGLFNGRIPGRPLLIYTDYTFLHALNEPGHDPRMFRSKTYLRYEADLYRRAEMVATTGAHVERTLIDRYGCDPARVRTVHIGANVDIGSVDSSPARYTAQHILFVGVEWERKGGPARCRPSSMCSAISRRLG